MTGSCETSYSFIRRSAASTGSVEIDSDGRALPVTARDEIAQVAKALALG